MDTITTSWIKIVCLFVIAGILLGILAWAWKCFKTAIKDIKEAAQLEIQAYELKENKQSPKPKTWVAEIIQPKDHSKPPCYYFHCTSNAYNGSAGISLGKCYLYTPTGRGFVTTENPTTAILLQQLLNEGQLTVKPFTTETQ